MPNGQIGEYNVVEKSDAVWVVPVTTDGLVAMVYQYRYTINEWCWEVPAGGVKSGQSLEDAAAEELQEEVGGTAQTWEYIGRYYLANGICNEVGHFFLATGVTIGSNHHEAAEVMHIHLLPVAKVLAMARAHEIPMALRHWPCSYAPENLTHI
jgi:8-oxo-dGTP pyrophosphatase MutT (NUDIX family)